MAAVNRRKLTPWMLGVGVGVGVVTFRSQRSSRVARPTGSGGAGRMLEERHAA